MVVIERKPGLGVCIGPYVLEVLAVHADEVVIALIGPEEECVSCGERGAHLRRCSVCQAEVIVCSPCAESRACPNCASGLECPQGGLG